MGITKFKTFLNNFKGIKFNTKLENISSLFIDCNGIFHKGKAEVYKLSRDRNDDYIYPDEEREKISKMDPKKLEKIHIKFIIDEFEKVLKLFKPSSTLILAPDGMAPVAKMQQQKERRYGKNEEEDKLFMGSSISPGTEFMINLDSAIKKWLSEENENFPEKVIYSSHLCAGEGEHKIFDFIRNRDIETARGNHVIYGADGDLFIISLLSPLRNIYLFDENNKEYFTINKLKFLIAKEMNYNETIKKERDFNFEKQLIRDFCFLTFIVGNDFMRKLPNLYDTNTSLKILIDVYKKNGKDLTSYKNKIIWRNLLSFLKILNDYKYRGMSLYQLSAFGDVRGWEPYPEIVESFKVFDEEKEEIKEIKKSTLLNPKNTFVLDKQILAKLWYNKQFKPRNPELREKYEDMKYCNKKDVFNMCKYYFKTLQWSFYYYNLGGSKINQEFYYPYFFTPLLESLTYYLEYNISINNYEFDKNIYSTRPSDLTPVHQLMLILPLWNKSLIPSPFREIYTENLASISPEDYETLPQEGTNANYFKIKLIPPVNPFLVKKVLKGIEIPEKFSDAGVLILKKD